MVKLKGGMSQVAILSRPGFSAQRKADLVRSIEVWADMRSVSIQTVQLEKPLDLARWKEWDFAYCPLTAVSSNELSLLPPKLPVVVDISARIDDELRSSLNGLRVAARIPWFVDIRGSGIEQLLPMVPPPPPQLRQSVAGSPSAQNKRQADSSEKTIVFIDSKPFHETSTLLQVAATLAGILESVERLEGLLGRKIWFYFTSFMPKGLYEDLLDSLDEQVSLKARRRLSDLLSERVLPGSKEYATYQSLLDKALLFITEHGELADFDLAQAMLRGTPTLLFKRKIFSKSQGIRSSIGGSLRLIDDSFPAAIDQAEQCRVREEWGIDNIFTHKPKERLDPMLYERVYLGSWDIAHSWALGKPNPDIHSALLKADRYSAGAEIVQPT